MIDNEDMWTNYEMEEAEVAIDVADMVLDTLVIESIQNLANIQMRPI